MADEKGSVTISIMGKEYKIGCPPEEVEGLRQSARHLNEQMGMIKSRAGTYSFETMAVLAALNISHELVKQARQGAVEETDTSQELRKLEEKIELAIRDSRQLEI